jgi:hypothetical protein
VDQDPDDTVIRPPQDPDGSAESDSESDLDRELVDTPRIGHATGIPVLPDLLVVPRAPDTVPVQVIGYALRVAGEVVPLDREVFVGRSPAPTRIQSGEAPRLVAVPSPRSDVSRTHVAIHQLGGSVVVTDLRSTNGSRVAVPGSAPRTLRQGESMVVPTGTLIDIGDDNVIEVLRLQPAGLAEEGTS